MLTGDSGKAAEKAASQIGITEVFSELLPHDKVSKIEILLEELNLILHMRLLLIQLVLKILQSFVTFFMNNYPSHLTKILIIYKFIYIVDIEIY